jgi:hypothetical protein
LLRFMIVTPLNRPPQLRRSRCAAMDVAATQSQFMRHDPSLPLVIGAVERRRVKAVRQS